SQDEAQGHDGADHVARDHHPLAVEAIEQDAGDGAGQHSRNSARQHHATDSESRARVGQNQAEDGDVVEVIAYFTNHLAHPGVAIIAIVLQDTQEGGHQPRSVRTTPVKITAPPAMSGSVTRSRSAIAANSVAITG